MRGDATSSPFEQRNSFSFLCWACALRRRKSLLSVWERLTEHACAGNRGRLVFGSALGGVKSKEKSIGRRATDDAHLADAAFEGALGGLEFENHAAGDHAALDEALALF